MHDLQLHDRLSGVRRRFPRYAITFDRAQQIWRADRSDHVIVEHTLDELEEALERNNPMKGVDQ
jgi:hypothetical protein